MRAIVLIFSILIVGGTCLGEIVVEKSKLIVSGIYKYSDGRVKHHDFHVVLELNNDGTATGYYEAWIEKRFMDKPSELKILKIPVKGQWEIKCTEFQISLASEDVLPEFTFKKCNGVSVKITKLPSKESDVDNKKKKACSTSRPTSPAEASAGLLQWEKLSSLLDWKLSI